jgi:hypothetical protein
MIKIIKAQKLWSDGGGSSKMPVPILQTLLQSQRFSSRKVTFRITQAVFVLIVLTLLTAFMACVGGVRADRHPHHRPMAIMTP